MTRTIDTVAHDIQEMFADTYKGVTTQPTEEVLTRLGVGVAKNMMKSLEARREVGRKPNTIYMSEIGQPCVRKTWLSYHRPDLAEPMQGQSLFKFLYGDVIEELVLTLAEVAGHTVEKRQQSISWPLSDGWQVNGRIDAEIDGVLVDVKGVSPFSYKKFEEGLSDRNDTFGYRAQLNGYNMGAKWERQGFLAVDKQNGKIGWFEQPRVSPAITLSQIHYTKAVLSNTIAVPPREYGHVPEGASGNMKLQMECSYCPFKQACWAGTNGGAGLQAYAYNYGPIFLTEVKRTPRVPAIPLPPIITTKGALPLEHTIA